MLQPSTERVRLDPTSRGLDPIAGTTAEGLRFVWISDGSIEIHVGGPGLFGWILFLVLVGVVVAFGLALHATVFEIALWVTVASLVLLALVLYGDDGVHLTRIWRFAPGRVSRDMRLPLPAACGRVSSPMLTSSRSCISFGPKEFLAGACTGGTRTS